MIYVVFLRYLDHNFDLHLNFKQLGNKITSTQGQEWIESPCAYVSKTSAHLYICISYKILKNKVPTCNFSLKAFLFS